MVSRGFVECYSLNSRSFEYIKYIPSTTKTAAVFAAVMLAYAFRAQFAPSQTHLHDCKRSNNKITEKRREDKRRTADIKHESHNIHSFIRVQHSLIPFSVSKIKLQLKRSRLEIVYTHNTNAHMKWNRSNACETRIRLCSFRCIRQHPDNWKKKLRPRENEIRKSDLYPFSRAMSIYANETR